MKEDEGIEQDRNYVEFIHPEYDSRTTDNDMCLLKLNEPLDLDSDLISSIKLNNETQVENGPVFLVSGNIYTLGAKNSNYLIISVFQSLHLKELQFCTQNN